MRKPEAEDIPESDAFEGAPHPRHAVRLIGQSAAEQEMLSAYRDRRLAHAWLIGGPEGVGKATLAWRFARFVLAHPDPESRGVREARDLFAPPDHPAARNLVSLAHPDFALVRREWQGKSFATEIGVDTVRRALDVFHLSAAFGGWRVVLVDCAEDLNRNSANALLKMIEEPPQRALILIVSHRPGQVLATIRSRCRKLKLDRLAPADIVDVIGGLGPPWSELDPDAVRQAAARADGSARAALARLDPSAQGVGALIDQAIERLPSPDPRLVLKLAEAIGARAQKDAYETFHRAVFDWLASAARRSAASPARAAAIAELFERVRMAARETDALNLDRKLHILSMFADIAASARGA